MTALGDLFPGAALSAQMGARRVAGVTSDSRAVTLGTVFFAVPGARAHGLSFVPDALARGALAVVAEQPYVGPMAEAEFIEVPDVRHALSMAAAALHPRQPETIVAVTGTSGKTSVAAFARQIWSRLGFQAASVGTLGVVAPNGAIYGSLTTPDPVTLHATLARLAAEGVTHLAMEASSHGLDQRRLDGVRLTAGAFTNLSRDHLDYHLTFEAYLAAKLRLFEELLAPGQVAVIDADGEASARVIDRARLRGLKLFTVGVRGQDLRLIQARPDHAATALQLVCEGREIALRLPLAGLFQASNALVAAGLCIACGGAPRDVLPALEHLVGAPGRLEHVGAYNDGQIFVDYAHKPDALEKVLEALRPFARGALVVVVGCGGDRDPGKRPIMGEIAHRLADRVIVTDDNPRSENPAAIRAAILAAAPGALEIGDRGAAIGRAIGDLGPGDVLVIAGKGHETGQIVGAQTLPFSDHEAVAQALRELGA